MLASLLDSIQSQELPQNGALMSLTALWKQILDHNTPNPYALLETVRTAVESSQAPAEVSFGTSGWRGELGDEFTFRNVQVVAEAMVQMYLEADAELLEHLGVKNLDQWRKQGVVIGHDNRMYGREFAMLIGAVFAREGVMVYYGGEASTPEFSAAIEVLDAACAVNITPSHNPANYSGVKFNPKDGGPAGPEITSVITRLANARMASHVYHEPEPFVWEIVDLRASYLKFLQDRGTIDFAVIQKLVDSGKLALVTDHVHGATRGRPGFLLGEPKCLQTVRTEDDILFGRVAPEPSSTNMAKVRELIDASAAELKLGVIFDPDGDRIRYYDGTTEIDMNRFGAIAFHYLWVHRGLRGVCAKSVATSNFANAIAAKVGAPMAETAVGFKNFRPLLRKGCEPMAVIAFEESDGISGWNNTIEKDAQFGLLLALEMMAVTGKTLGQYLAELQAEFGFFYPERKGFEVEKSMAGAPLTAKITALGERMAPGQVIRVGENDKTIAEVLTLDGVKIIFGDQSWMLIRGSGTEPKVRIYTECRSADEQQPMFEAAKALFFA